MAIDARRQRREDDLARAARTEGRGGEASAAFERTMSRARAEAQAVLKETSDRLAAEAADAPARTGRRVGRADRRGRAPDRRDQGEALAEVRGIAIDVGRSVVEKLTGSAPDAAR